MLPLLQLKPQMRSEFPTVSEKVALYVLWGARCREARERGEREREEAALALRATRPHTVGYIGVCDQEQGVPHAVELLAHEPAGRVVLPLLGGKACWLIRKHDHFTPAREMRRDIKALTSHAMITDEDPLRGLLFY